VDAVAELSAAVVGATAPVSRVTGSASRARRAVRRMPGQRTSMLGVTLDDSRRTAARG